MSNANNLRSFLGLVASVASKLRQYTMFAGLCDLPPSSRQSRIGEAEVSPSCTCQLEVIPVFVGRVSTEIRGASRCYFVRYI